MNTRQAKIWHKQMKLLAFKKGTLFDFKFQNILSRTENIPTDPEEYFGLYVNVYLIKIHY